MLIIVINGIISFSIDGNFKNDRYKKSNKFLLSSEITRDNSKKLIKKINNEKIIKLINKYLLVNINKYKLILFIFFFKISQC